MKPSSLRPAVFLLLTLALAAPTLANILNSNESAVGAGLHLGGAILVSWAAVGIVGYLIDSYRVSSARRAHRQERPAQRS
ncbi:MAG TPA: hypothetical protein VME20_02740 [Acidimicrobiales bacterium]|nr:hypothetical protein [Acidimicrobiales bacterium]